jgi:hypothetical protein
MTAACAGVKLRALGDEAGNIRNMNSNLKAGGKLKNDVERVDCI